MKFRLLAYGTVLLGASLLLAASLHAGEPTVVIVAVGASGTPEFGQQFADWEARWRSACEAAGIRYVAIGTSSSSEDAGDRERLKSEIDALADQTSDPAWIVFLGHGTSFGDAAKFNLRGPDVSADELKNWLEPIRRPIVFINCSSSSGPFASRLSREDRVIITATQSGAEQNFCRFGQFLSLSISNLAADVDHDQQVSLLEAFLTASRQVQRFYDGESRLASEHAILDDNGDGLGTPATFFSGIRVSQVPAKNALVDGLRAHQCFLARGPHDRLLTQEQMVERDGLEKQIEDLRKLKPSLGEAEYYARLESLMLTLAQLYQQSEPAKQ
jgi:hypothetical protein